MILLHVFSAANSHACSFPQQMAHFMRDSATGDVVLIDFGSAAVLPVLDAVCIQLSLTTPPFFHLCMRLYIMHTSLHAPYGLALDVRMCVFL